MTASSEGDTDPGGRVDGSGGRVSAWVQDHTPLAIAIAGLLSALFTLLAANPAITKAIGFGEDAKEASYPQKVTAEVVTPADGEISQDPTLAVSGRYDGALQGRSIWAFVRNVKDDTLWPSHEPCSVAKEGQWSCRITPLPDVSELQLRLVDSRGVNEILQWVVEENAGSAPALSKVNGSELLAQKTLSRQGARGGAAAASGEDRPG
ncbi:hypothetical protein ACFY0F_32925 [Streptomyces sp. NPDC001544]|uniref:hypothetical protein n=1 Tax=Streptomyces sp. NPDC001544 TaxID=3364584 RepID=UPI0036BDDE7F